MNVQIGTSPFPNRGANVTAKPSGENTTDPAAYKKAFGDKGLDQVLNQISDPNYKAKQRRVNGVGNPELGRDAFFKLMLTQLKQQDPTNPMKSHEMAAQLAQFSSVEQLSNIGESLEKMNNKESNDQYQLLNLIGKVVSGDSSKIKRVLGDKEHNIEFELKGSAEAVKVKIKDATGGVVKEYDLKNLQAGKNSIVWNGLNNDGKDLSAGDYRAEIVAHNGGRKTIVSTRFKGSVEGIQFSKGGPLLVVEGKTMALKDVSRIEIDKAATAAKPQPMAAMGMGQASPGVPGAAGKIPAGQIPAGQMAKLAVPVPNMQAPAAKKPAVNAVNAIDVNKKYSKGAFETKPVLANLDQAKMDNALKQKLVGKKSLGGK